MNEDEEMLKALHRLHIQHQRALQTSVGHPVLVERKRDFRHTLAEFVLSLGLDPDTTNMLHSAAMNPLIPQGDALWDD